MSAKSLIVPPVFSMTSKKCAMDIKEIVTTFRTSLVKKRFIVSCPVTDSLRLEQINSIAMSVTNIMSKYPAPPNRKPIADKLTVNNEKMPKSLLTWHQHPFIVELLTSIVYAAFDE